MSVSVALVPITDENDLAEGKTVAYQLKEDGSYVPLKLEIKFE